MTTNNGGQAAPLTPSNVPAPPPAEELPLRFSIKIWATSPEGFVCEIAGSEVERPAVFIGQMTAGLEKLRFSPIDPFVPATVDVDVAGGGGGQPSQGGGGGQAQGGEVRWIKGEGGKPPRCPVHGAAKWVEGTYRAGHAKAGQHYEFWSCTDRNCHPKGEAA